MGLPSSGRWNNSYGVQGEIINFYNGTQILSFPYFEYQNFSLLSSIGLPALVLFAIASILVFPFHQLDFRGLAVRIVSWTKEVISPAMIIQPLRFDAGLSGLRGLAAFSIVLVHSGPPFVTPFWNLISESLQTGVFVFLMLSMFLLLHRLDANPDLKHYFMRRIIRIWPIYFGCVIAFYFLFNTLQEWRS